MKTNNDTITIKGCPDCPLNKESNGMGANDYVCKILGEWTFSYNTENKYSILDKCPMKTGKKITIERVSDKEIKKQESLMSKLKLLDFTIKFTDVRNGKNERF